MNEVEIWIDAAPQQVWALVSDVTRYGEWSPENRGGRWRDVPGPGAVFKGENRHGLMRWSTTCTVLDYEAPSVFTFDVAESRMRWGFVLRPENGGTRVVQWRRHTGTAPLPIRLIEASGLVGRNRERLMVEGMRRTVMRIKEAAEGETRHALSQPPGSA